MPADEICSIISAIGNHDEGTGQPLDAISAAMIIGDKTDVRRSRVRNKSTIDFDIHDRVNYSVTASNVEINEEKTEILLQLTIDTDICSLMDYFEIFLGRMVLCRKAADKLGLVFGLEINGQRMV